MQVIELTGIENSNSIVLNGVTGVEQTINGVGVVTQRGQPGTAGVGVPPGGSTGQALTKISNTDHATAWADDTTPDATTTSKGIIQLAGDLGGTANLPTVTGLSSKVVGPATATDNAIARFDGTTGKLIKNSATTVSLAEGGTGASTAAGARTNLGAVNIAGDTMTGLLTINPTGDGAIELPMSSTTHRPNIKFRDFTNGDDVVTLTAHQNTAGDLAAHNHFSIYTSDATLTARNRFSLQFGKDDPDIEIGRIGTVNIRNTDNGDANRKNRNVNDIVLDVELGTLVDNALAYTLAGEVARLTNSQTETSGTITNSAVVLNIRQQGDTGDAVVITNSSTGNAISITQSAGTGSNVTTDGALHINNSNNNGAGLAIYSTLGSAATAPLAYIAGTSATFARPGLRVQTAGTAETLLIDNRGTGAGLSIKNNATEYFSVGATGLVTVTNKITGLSNGTAPTDAVNKSQLDLKINATEKGAASGIATLGADSKVPTSQLPALAITSTTVVASQVAQLALVAQEGDVAIRSDQNKSYIHNGGVAGTMADWNELLTPTDTVLSVNTRTGAVTGLAEQSSLDTHIAAANPHSGSQPLDATLTSLAAHNTAGLLTQTAPDTFTGRTLTGTANQITVTNGDGVAGNPTVSLPANLYNAGYLRVGSATAPTNTTAGDITGIRLSLNNSTLGAGGRIVNVAAAASTSTVASAEIFANFVNTLTPTANSATEHRALQFQNVINSATGITFTSTGGIDAGYFENRVRSDGNITQLNGVYSRPLFFDASSAATASMSNVYGYLTNLFNTSSSTTIGTVNNLNGYVVDVGTGTAGITYMNATTLRGYLMNNPGANHTISALIGVDVAALTRGSTNIGLRIAAPSGGATANYAIQLSDTSGGAAGGITFGTGLQLWRSAALTLSLTDGAGINTGTTTGLKVGTATSQKLGFFNNTPVVQPTATPADATDLASALTLINDLKAKLISLGLVA